MSKKLICVALFVALLMTVALADGVPSKTTTALTTVVLSDEVAATGLIIDMTEPESELVKTTLTEVAAYVANGRAVVGYFGADVRNEITAILQPAGVIAESLTLSEFGPLYVANYEAGTLEEVEVVFEFTTVYTADQNVIVLIGIVGEDGVITWTPIQAEVTEEGALKVVIPADLLEAAQAGEAVLAVLND